MIRFIVFFYYASVLILAFLYLAINLFYWSLSLYSFPFQCAYSCIFMPYISLIPFIILFSYSSILILVVYAMLIHLNCILSMLVCIQIVFHVPICWSIQCASKLYFTCLYADIYGVHPNCASRTHMLIYMVYIQIVFHMPIF